jgi:hypothetical protein
VFEGADGELLGAGFAANLTALRALQQRARLSDAAAADSLCVSLRTYRRWLQHGNPSPTAVRLLAILAGFVPWAGWEGWEVHQGALFPPGYQRGGIVPGEFYALVFYRQLVTEQRRKISALEAELAEVKAQARDVDVASARACNTGTLCHGWHSDASASRCVDGSVLPFERVSGR